MASQCILGLGRSIWLKSMVGQTLRFHMISSSNKFNKIINKFIPIVDTKIFLRHICCQQVMQQHQGWIGSLFRQQLGFWHFWQSWLCGRWRLCIETIEMKSIEQYPWYCQWWRSVLANLINSIQSRFNYFYILLWII